MFKKIICTFLFVGNLVGTTFAGNSFSTYTKEYVSPDGRKRHMITTTYFMGRRIITHAITTTGYDKNGNLVCNSYSYTE